MSDCTGTYRNVCDRAGWKYRERHPYEVGEELDPIPKYASMIISFFLSVGIIQSLLKVLQYIGYVVFIKI